MAGVEIKGFEELRRNVAAFEKAIVDEALKAAEDAAAQIVKQAVEAAAPRRTGQLASSVKIFESRNRKTLSGQTRLRILIGPEKKKGFYGYFLESGWVHAGRGGKRIPGTGWFSKTAASIESQAQQAGEQAFFKRIQQLAK
jgi:hypothetical protein